MPFEQPALEHRGTAGALRESAGVCHIPDPSALSNHFQTLGDLRLTPAPGAHLALMTNIALHFLPAMSKNKI